jgi:lipase chaperone LimK
MGRAVTAAQARPGLGPAARLGLLGTAALVAAAGLWAWDLGSGTAGVRLADRSEWGPGEVTTASPPPAERARDAGTVRDPASLQAWLETHSSLQGATLDGDWGLDAQGALRPGLGVRRRFDQLLTLQGEASLAELRALVGEGVRAAARAAGLSDDAAQGRAGEVQALWDRYVALLAHPWQRHPRVDDAASLAAALAERQPVRRAQLGAAWADAFYGEEEAALLTLLRAMETGTAATSASPPLIDRAQLGADAQARLDAELQAQADWNRRLALARAERARLGSQAGLSAPQRAEAWRTWRDAHFEAAERARVDALLGGAD